MKALITGGAGFIGSHLAERLLAGGDEVIAIDDLSTGDIRNLDKVRQVFLQLVSYPDVQRVDASPSIPEVRSHVEEIALDVIRPFRMSGIG